jgi:hypothetical protein
MAKNKARLGQMAAVMVLVGLTATCFAAGAGTEAGPLLKRIKAVGGEGAGNAEAGRAWRELVQLGPGALLETLAALDDADPTAANWLRNAVDAIADRELAAGRPLPAAELEAFVRDTRHAGQGRRLAYEWLARIDAKAPDRLLPGMLNDPGAELRRDAVARALEDARKRKDKDKPVAVAAYRKLFDAARDRDQVELIAKELKGLGAPVDVREHLGVVTRWLLAGPFDNTGGAGFKKAFPPEQAVDPDATYEGKKGAKIRWVEHTAEEPSGPLDVSKVGMVDLNKALGKHMGAVGYAFAVVDSPAERPVEVRASSNNAVKIFLNGKQIFFREEYHHGVRMDQHVGAGKLKAGRNEILIKVCQNEQTDAWAQLWSFQLRVCDALGGAVPLTVALPPKTQKTQRDEK